MKRTFHRPSKVGDRTEAHQTPRPSTGDGGLAPQPSASALTEPEPVRDAAGTGGASGGFNSSIGGVAGSSLDTTPKAAPRRKMPHARGPRQDEESGREP
jgi:hypothetical protein